MVRLPPSSYSTSSAVDLELPLVDGTAAGKPESHAVVLHQVGWMPWNRVPLEVVGRSDNRHGNRAAERHGNHVLLDAFPRANAGVEPSFDDVDVTLVVRHLDLDVRVRFQEPGQQRLQDHGDRDAGRVDAQHARRPALKRMKLLSGFQHVAQRRPDSRQVGLAGLGEAEASGGSVQQPDTEPGLEVADRLTERGGRDVERCRGGGEPAMLCDLPEGEQSMELVELHILKNNFIRYSVSWHFSSQSAATMRTIEKQARPMLRVSPIPIR